MVGVTAIPPAGSPRGFGHDFRGLCLLIHIVEPQAFSAFGHELDIPRPLNWAYSAGLGMQY